LAPKDDEMTKPVKRLTDDKDLMEKLSESGAVVSRADGRGVSYFPKDRFVSAERVTVTKLILRDNAEIQLVNELPEEIETQLNTAS
jgi:hypothetical protein